MFREFHPLGAATGKAREKNTVVAGGCCSNKAEVDHRGTPLPAAVDHLNCINCNLRVIRKGKRCA